MAQAEGAKPKKKVVARAQVPASEDLVLLIQDLKNEVQTLRTEIQGIREAKPIESIPDTHLPEAEAIFENMVGQMSSVCTEDFNLLGDEIAFALENPQLEPEIGGNLGEVTEADEDTQLSTEELDALIEATTKLNESMIEESSSETAASASSDNDMMSAEDIATLLAGTEPSRDTVPEEPTITEMVSECAPSPFAEADDSMMSAEEIEALLSGASNPGGQSDSEETNVGQMLSQDEIQKLLSIPTQSDSPEEPEAAEIVSAEEIQAMLGLKSPDEQSEPSQVSEAELLEMQKVKVGEMSPEDVEESSTLPTEIQFDQISESAIALIQGVTAAQALAIPICVIEGKLHCIGLEPFDDACVAELSKESGHEVIMHPGSIERIINEIRLRYSPSDDQDLWRNRVRTFSMKLPQFGKKSA